ncbi:uncharacterized protein BKCO1_7300053 [Diplodia corticola]|uniref:Uncharacterized protein n=1 Tax=Diplodia corticola TaxID=236234 RepID=A0A1J9RP58_9PEZI|nr:uncharacterized protein BKCO1_7300053 [Diplodia corticola]OJD29708.1 hypothetical protein BKCO1_7300053 [Diplodia corticola]
MAGVTRHLKKQHNRELERCSICSRFFLARGDRFAHPNDPTGCQRRGAQRGCAHPQSQPNSPLGGRQAVEDVQRYIQSSLSQHSPNSQGRSLYEIRDWLTDRLSEEKYQSVIPAGHGYTAIQSQGSHTWRDTSTAAEATSMQLLHEPEPQLDLNSLQLGLQNSATGYSPFRYSGASQGPSPDPSRQDPHLDHLYGPFQLNQQEFPVRMQAAPGDPPTGSDSRNDWDNITDPELYSIATGQDSYKTNSPNGWMPQDRFRP